MSDNKYIIDKDSLTGIADAVRDKLGTGEATTDETTGEIVYPKDKGYYLKSVDCIAVSDFHDSYNNGTYSKYIVRFQTSDYSEKVEKPFSQIEMEGYIYWYSLTPTLKINGNSFSLENDSTTPQKITKVFDTPQSYLSVEFSIYNKYARAQLFYFKDIKILLKDENGVPIKLVSSGFPVYYGYPSTMCTIENVIQGVTPIPFTIDNIQDKITNYLEKKSSMVKTKLFLKRKSSSTEETDYGEYSNYFWTTSAYNYNVGTSDPSYITTKAPDLRPENIIYMSVISSNNNEHFYEFRPQLYAMEHYSSLTQSGSGKRLTTATDYYFFPNGSKLKSYSETYGILAHWDSNNLILDLQSVQKSSGTIDGTISANSSAYITPYSLYIIYKEATE